MDGVGLGILPGPEDPTRNRLEIPTRSFYPIGSCCDGPAGLGPDPNPRPEWGTRKPETSSIC